METPRLSSPISSLIEDRYLTDSSTLPFRSNRAGVETQVAINITPRKPSIALSPQRSFSRKEIPNIGPPPLRPPSPRPPLPSKNNSPKKILQIMGHDPNLDRNISPCLHDTEDWKFSWSSSLYSVQEDGSRYSSVKRVDDNKLISSPHPGKEVSQTLIRQQEPSVSRWSLSDNETKVTAKVAQKRRSSGLKSLKSVKGIKSTGNDETDGLTTLREMFNEEL